MTTHYENGPEGMPRVERMTESTLDALIRHSPYRIFVASLEGEPLRRLHSLMHAVAEETLARVPCWPAERTTSPVMDAPDTSQDWAKLDGATAFHLIERHAEDWAETGRMMESWLAARMAAAAPHAQAAPAAPVAEQNDLMELVEVYDKTFDATRTWKRHGEALKAVYEHGKAASPQEAEPVGYVFGNSYWEVGNPRLTADIKRLGHPRYAAPVIRQPQDERAAFEVWAASRLASIHRHKAAGHDLNGSYISVSTQAAWEAWQARAAMAKGGAANCQDNEGEKA